MPGGPLRWGFSYRHGGVTAVFEIDAIAEAGSGRHGEELEVENRLWGRKGSSDKVLIECNSWGLVKDRQAYHFCSSGGTRAYYIGFGVHLSRNLTSR